MTLDALEDVAINEAEEVLVLEALEDVDCLVPQPSIKSDLRTSAYGVPFSELVSDAVAS